MFYSVVRILNFSLLLAEHRKGEPIMWSIFFAIDINDRDIRLKSSESKSADDTKMGEKTQRADCASIQKAMTGLFNCLKCGKCPSSLINEKS